MQNQGWICPRCGCSNSYLSKQCAEKCHIKTEVTSFGTGVQPFQNTPITSNR